MNENSVKDKKKQNIYLDDILNKFSIFGRYHCVMGVFIYIAYASNTLYCVNYVFVVQSIDYRCISSNECNVSFNNLTTEESKCYERVPLYNIVTCNEQNETNTKLQRCTKWSYENPNSFVAEFDLGCQDWKRTLVGTVHSFANMVGLLFVGPLSDRLGRKRAAILTGFLGGVFGLTRSFTYNYWLYIALEFLESSLGDSCSPFFTLNMEIAGSKYRSLYYAITQFGFPTGSILFPLIAWNFQYWRTLLRVLYTPGLLFALYYFVIDESPRWLLSKGKKEEAVVILEKMANWNKVNITEKINNIAFEKDEHCDIGQFELLKNTFKSKELLKRFMICVIWWITSIFVTYGITVNSVFLKGNKYLNYFMIKAVKFPASIIMGYVLTKFQRKLPLLIAFLAAAIIFLIQPFLPVDDFPWLSILFFMAGNAANTVFFCITYVYTSELFPTYTRNSMHALCSSLGRIGSILASQTPLLIKYYESFPAILFGCASLIAGLVTIFVPETAKAALPDTVNQAEMVSKRHSSYKSYLDK